MVDVSASFAPPAINDLKAPQCQFRIARTGMTGNVPDQGAESWRDARRYTRLRGIDRAGLMWEWLRRDSDYIAWYARASQTTRGSAMRAAEPIQWGLHFR